MYEAMMTLANVYNFIECRSPPPIESSIPMLADFTHIHSLLGQFIESDHDPKYVFQELKLFLTKEQEMLGPRKFKCLVQHIWTVLLEYVVMKYRKQQVDRAVLCITYFQRDCQKYLTPTINILINLTYSLAHFFKKTYKSMSSYLQQSNQIVKINKASIKINANIQDLQLLIAQFQGIYNLYSGQLSKSKAIYCQLISRVTVRIHQQKLKIRSIQPLTVNYFVLATYFISKAYRQMGQFDVGNYNLTQCYQFAEAYLPFSQPMLQQCSETLFITNKRVKLSRIQNKIERMKSLHSINKNHSNDISRTNHHSRHGTEFKIKKISKEIKIDPKTLDKQLDTLFVINDQKEYAIKKRTLRALHKEDQNSQNRIQYFQQSINSFQSQKVSVQQGYKLQEQKKHIQEVEQKKKQLKNEIRDKLWAVVGTLKPTKKIESYLLAFKTAINYEHSNKFYRFLCSQLSVMGQLLFYIMIRKFKKKMKIMKIKTIYINGIRHQLELLKHRNQNIYQLKVYNVVSGPGIDYVKQIDEDTYKGLFLYPLEYYFQVQQTILIPIRDYLQSLNPKTLFKMKMFISKLKKQVQKAKHLLTYSKRQIYVTFSQYRTDLKYKLFISTKELGKQMFSHTIERIDTVKHQNTDYNIKLLQTVINNSPYLSDNQLDNLLTRYILEGKQKYENLIKRIQGIFRLILSKKCLNRNKEGINVIVTKINENLFTLVIRGHNRTFFIEHLHKQYPKIILKNAEFNSLAFINRLRDKLIETDDSGEHLKIIQKYFKLRSIYRKLTRRSKELQLENNFSTKFKISLCFAKKAKQILYKGKRIEVDAMYMLTIRDFDIYPRTYLLRVFNLQSHSLYHFDVEIKIQMQEKHFLQNNLDKIHQNVDVLGYKQAIILLEGPAKSLPKSKRINSKSTIFSNYSFCSGEQYAREVPRSRLNTKLQSRQSYAFTRKKKDSINFKMRHKSALKQKDILLIKKWIEDCNQNFNVSEKSEISN